MESLDQSRARFAWEKVQGQSKEYATLAKGAPALIMQSGLMPVLAFLQEKGKDHHAALRTHLCEWLAQCFKSRINNGEFKTVMESLMGSRQGHASEHAQFYRMATEETLALLRWIRQFAAAVAGDTQGGRHA